MNLTPEQIAAGQKAFCDCSRRDFLKAAGAAGIVCGGALGGFYFGYSAIHGSPVRVGVLGTGDEGNVLLGAINPEYVQVVAIADVRPYNQWRAFHGDHDSDAALAARKGLMAVYGWKTEDEARQHVKVYEDYKDLLKDAKSLGIEAVIIALPLHLHAPAAIAAMEQGLHVLTEKLMAHSVFECKEMAQAAKLAKVHLATGHQRHYNILYEEAMDTIQRGLLGDLHYIRAQWHRGNMPGGDSWQQPMPENFKPNDPQAKKLAAIYNNAKNALESARGPAIEKARIKMEQARMRLQDKIVDATKYGYQTHDLVLRDGSPYHCPPGEELIRWRLWKRTGGGLMVELGSHQLDAASIFISAMHGGVKQHPLCVVASGYRSIFDNDREAEDHVICQFEYPTPGYDPKDDIKSRNRISVQYSTINGNGFGGYGEIVYGTKGTLILEREQEVTLLRDESATAVGSGGGSGPTMDTQASGASQKAATAAGPTRKVSRGYTEEIEHFAWCIRNNPDASNPDIHPRCTPKVAMGDACIALVTNMAAAQSSRIEFKESWFDPESDDTPEGVRPDLNRYKA